MCGNQFYVIQDQKKENNSDESEEEETLEKKSEKDDDDESDSDSEDNKKVANKKQHTRAKTKPNPKAGNRKTSGMKVSDAFICSSFQTEMLLIILSLKV